MESFWHSLKVEETRGRGFKNFDVAKRCMSGYIEGFYNTTRMHSSINWQSPRALRRAFEAQRLAATTAASAGSENMPIFYREPSPPGEDITESMSANQQNISRSMSAEKSATQASRISL